MGRKNEFLSNKDVLKDAIRYCILMNNNRLSSLHLQKLLGLKKQTIYNYLNELVEEKKIEGNYKQHTHRSHLLVNYYSFLRTPKEDTHVELMDSLPELFRDPKPSRTEEIGDEVSKIDPEKMTSIRAHLDTQLNYSIAGILVIKKFLNSLNDLDLIHLLQHDFPNFKDNPEGFVFTHNEYNLLLREIFSQSIEENEVENIEE